MIKIKNVINLSKLFKNEDGRQLNLTPGQQQLFKVIVTREPKRNWVSCVTQYGKSLVASLGMIVRATTFPEKWCIIGATEKKTKIIMNYVIGHLFDNLLFKSQLELESDISFERLKRERSKNRLTFKRGGEIFILSAQATNAQVVEDSLTGFGSPNIVIDDSSLIPDNLYSMIKRMLGGHKDNFLLELGNPFRRNHFLKSYKNNEYNKIKIDYHQAIREGRITEEFIDEMRQEAFFDVLYECKFPSANLVDDSGWTALFTDVLLDKIMHQIEPAGKKRLGVDVGGGVAYNAYVVRADNYAYLKRKDRCSDTMETVGNIQQIMDEEKIKASDVFVDDTGIGHGVSDRLIEKEVKINRVTVGQSAERKDRFINRRAELYWRAKEWCNNGGILEDNSDFGQLLDIKYKVDSDRRIKVISKEELRKKGILSPDVADAFSLTFLQQEVNFFPKFNFYSGSQRESSLLGEENKEKEYENLLI